MTTSIEKPQDFESRKADHIRLALDKKTQATSQRTLDLLTLEHQALPDIDFDQIDLAVDSLGLSTPCPLFVSSMTAGHANGVALNRILAEASSQHGWLMGVGSQRRELHDQSAADEWKTIRKAVPNVRFLGNLGVSQLIHTPLDDVRRLADNLEADAFFIHCNPLQEVIQPEGTPQFSGGLQAIERLCAALPIPVIVKETGCGFSRQTLQQLNGTGIAAVDISGNGGTHWGRIEGYRAPEQSIQQTTADTFRNWGISTVDSLLATKELKLDYALWGSGGVRSGLDAAKLLTIGADMVGIAQPLMAAAVEGIDALNHRMDIFEYELKVALFCTGSKTIKTLQENATWHYQKT